jgi:hypothetical protein
MEILSFLLNLATNIIPSGLVLLGGLFALLLSGGAWETKYSEKTKTIFRVVGLTSLIIGLLWTFLVAVLQTWESYSAEIVAISRSIAPAIVFVISPYTLLVLVLIGLFAIIIRYWRIRQIESGYKVRTKGVVKPSSERGDFQEAKILVENTGNDKFICGARLISVVKKGLNEKEYQKVDVDEINPDGNFLDWGTDKSYEEITKEVPKPVQLLISFRETYTYGKKMVFTFVKYSQPQPLDWGYYKVKVNFMRWGKNKWVYLDTFEGTIMITSQELKWM